jgi:metal-dependent amidase/aminoacylase/carboxypeptidase family protein
MLKLAIILSAGVLVRLNLLPQVAESYPEFLMFGELPACGHDTYVAMLMGVAEALATHRDQIPGTIKFIFKPADEGPPPGEEGGVEMMRKEGVLKNRNVDVIFALHIKALLEIGHIEYTPGVALACVDYFWIDGV